MSNPVKRPWLSLPSWLGKRGPPPPPPPLTDEEYENEGSPPPPPPLLTDAPPPLLTDEEYKNYTNFLEEKKVLDAENKKKIINIIRPDVTYEYAEKYGVNNFIQKDRAGEYNQIFSDQVTNLEALYEKYFTRPYYIVTDKGRTITALLGKPKLSSDEFNMLPPSLKKLYSPITSKKTHLGEYGYQEVTVTEYIKITKGGMRKMRRQSKKSVTRSKKQYCPKFIRRQKELTEKTTKRMTRKV